MGRKREREGGLKSRNGDLGLVSGKTRSGKSFRSVVSCSDFANGGKDGSGSGGGPGNLFSSSASSALRSVDSCGDRSADLGGSVKESLWVEIHDLWIDLKKPALECMLTSGKGVSNSGSSCIAVDLGDAMQESLWVEIHDLWIILDETALECEASIYEDLPIFRSPRHGVLSLLAGSANVLSSCLPLASDLVEQMSGVTSYGYRFRSVPPCSVLANGGIVGNLLCVEGVAVPDVCSKLTVLMAASNPKFLLEVVDLGRFAVLDFEAPAPSKVSPLVRRAPISVGSMALSIEQRAFHLPFIVPRDLPVWRGVDCSERWFRSVWSTPSLLLKMWIKLWKVWVDGLALFEIDMISVLLSLVSDGLVLGTCFLDLNLPAPNLDLGAVDPHLDAGTPNMEMEPYVFCWAWGKKDLGVLGLLLPYDGSFMWSKWFYSFWQRSRSTARKDRFTRMLVASTGCFKPKLTFSNFD